MCERGNKVDNWKRGITYKEGINGGEREKKGARGNKMCKV